MLVTSIWHIMSHTGWSITMNGAFAGRSLGYLLPVVSAAAKVIDEQGQVYTAIAHEVLHDDNPQKVASLLSTHQSLSNPNKMPLMIGHDVKKTLKDIWELNLLTLMTRISPSS